MFQHKKLIVYQKALALAAKLFGVTVRVQRRLWPISTQLQRAAVSLLLNIAEGAAEFSGAEKARFYRIARRSAAEVAAALDLLARLDAITPETNEPAQAELEQIAAMLTTMVKVSVSRDTKPSRRENSRSRSRPHSP